VTALLFPVVAVYLYYLGAYAAVTQRLWSRYPPYVRELADCPACSGFWYGLALAGIGAWKHWTFFGIGLRDLVVILLCGAYVAVLVPVLHRMFLHQLTHGRRELDKERYDDDGSDGAA